MNDRQPQIPNTNPAINTGGVDTGESSRGDLVGTCDVVTPCPHPGYVRIGRSNLASCIKCKMPKFVEYER